jgi:transaldolase
LLLLAGMQAFACGAVELQLQAWGGTAEEMAAVGRSLYGLDDRIVVKVPITLAGVRAANALGEEGIPFTLTGKQAATPGGVLCFASRAGVRGEAAAE